LGQLTVDGFKFIFAGEIRIWIYLRLKLLLEYKWLISRLNFKNKAKYRACFIKVNWLM